MDGLPRYFVAQSDASPLDPLHPAMAAQVVDVLRWRRPGHGVAEVAVVRDLTGALHVHPGPFTALPAALRAAIHHHELAAGGLRTVDAAALWLLDADAMEQLPDTPGVNDPIYLRGRLSGPWTDDGAVIASGNLAVTRADVLAALVFGEPFALRLANALSGGARCMHMALPGGRTGEIAQGEAYVLAYALVPYELQPSDPANDAVAAQLIHDVLGALRADFKASKQPHWLVRDVLPVPSRAELEDRLTSEGWKIRGHMAVRPSGPPSGISGFISMALGVDYDRKITLPKEAPLATFIALAGRMIQSFPGFPDERATELIRRIEAHATALRPTKPIEWVTPGQPAQGMTGALNLPKRPKGEREEWEAQFERGYASPGLGARVTKIH